VVGEDGLESDRRGEGARRASEYGADVDEGVGDSDQGPVGGGSSRHRPATSASFLHARSTPPSHPFFNAASPASTLVRQFRPEQLNTATNNAGLSAARSCTPLACGMPLRHLRPYNLDWEVETSQTGASYADDMESFLASFRSALHAEGLSLSIDLEQSFIKQSDCSAGKGFVDLRAIGENVDLAILEDYASELGFPAAKCPSKLPEPQPCGDDFTSPIELMCVYMPLDKIGI
jgi:hypothetical protein